VPKISNLIIGNQWRFPIIYCAKLRTADSSIVQAISVVTSLMSAPSMEL
jgi:hypothetical protein